MNKPCVMLNYGIVVPISTLNHISESHLQFMKWLNDDFKSFLTVGCISGLINLLLCATRCGTYSRSFNRKKSRRNIVCVAHFEEPVGLTAEGILCHLFTLAIQEESLCLLTALPTPCFGESFFRQYS